MTIKGVKESMTIDRVEWRKLSYWESIADPKILEVKLCLFFIGKGNFIKRKIEKVKMLPWVHKPCTEGIQKTKQKYTNKKNPKVKE